VIAAPTTPHEHNQGDRTMSSAFVRTAVATAGYLGLFACGSGFAQTAEKGAAVSGGIEEIVVTATRREERLQDVPVSVSAFSQEKLDAEGLKNIDDLTRLTPGVSFSRNGMGSSANYNDENSDISVRGIDSSAGASTTGIYIDDTPVQSRHIGFGAVNVFPALFDVDRVEVLRGPQGTLFGAGAEGGALRFITPQPGLQHYTGYLRSELSTTRYGDPSYELGAAAGGPVINDVLAFRVSGSFRRDGGWVDRVNYTRPNPADPYSLPVYASTTEKAANWQETVNFRAALKWQVDSAISVTPSIYYQELKIHDTAAYWLALSDPSAGIFRNGNARTNPSTDPFWIAAVKLDWDLGFGQLVSNTAYYSRDQRSTSDYTQYLRVTYALFGLLPNGYPQPGDGGYAPFGDKQNNFYQEVRIASSDANARLTWNGGVFFSHTNENIPENIIDPTLDAESGGNVCSAALPCPGGLIYEGQVDRVVEKQIALFGELGFKLVDTLKATVGLRLSKIDVTGTTFQGGPFLGTPLAATAASSSEKPVTPKVALSWQPDRDDLYYLSASKGYRAGGLNIGVGTICESDLATLGLPLGPDGVHHQVPSGFSSDSLWSYEFGAKNTVLDRRLQINSSLFLVDWKKIQQNVYLPSCGEQFVANLGQVRSQGGDIDVTYRPIDPLTLGLTVAYTNAKYTRASCAGVLTFNNGRCVGAATGANPPYPIVSQGDRLLGAPWTVLVSGEYAAPVAAFNGRTLYVRADYQHTTAQTALLPNQDFNNALFDNTIPGLPETRNLSLRAGLRFSGLDLSIFGNNLTNDHPLLFASRDIASCAPGSACPSPNSSPSPDNLYFGRSVRPRTVGVTATYRF
jgi:iron complex outermembrane recepter protein